MALYSQDGQHIISDATRKSSGGFNSAFYSQDGRQVITGGAKKSLFSGGFNPDGPKASMLYPESWNYQHFRDFRWRPYVVQDSEISIDASSRRNYISLSRQMFAQMGILDFGLELICDWAVGDFYDVIWNGPDKAFQSAFEDWVNNTWAKTCSAKGPTYNLKTILKNIIRETKRDGDLLQVYEFSRAGLPQLKYVRGHRIFQRTQKGIIEDGRYAGFLIEDGVIKNGNGVPIAYYIQDPSTPDNDVIINVRDCSLIYDPRYVDKDRGIPPITPSILDAFSSQELDDAYQRRLKLEALTALKVHNPSGEASLHNTGTWPVTDEPSTTSGVVPPLPLGVQVMKGGVRYIEYDGDITTLSSNTPNSEATSYMAGLEAKLLWTALGVPHQLLFNPGDLSRSPARGISEVFKKTISKNQGLIEQFITPAIIWAAGIAIQDGLLAPPPSNVKWWQYVDFTRPGEFTLDALNESKQQIEFYKLGLTTRDDITTSRQGKRGNAVLSAKTSEAVDVWSAAIEAKKQLQENYAKDTPEIQAEVNNISITTMHNSIEQTSANPLPEPPVQQAGNNSANASAE